MGGNGWTTGGWELDGSVAGAGSGLVRVTGGAAWVAGAAVTAGVSAGMGVGVATAG